MDFTLTEEQNTIKAMVQEFADQEIAPYAAQWDENNQFPLACYQHAAKLGLAGIYVKDDVGGSTLSRLTAAIIFETLAKACVPTAAYLSVHNMVSWLIDQYGNHEQRFHFLPKLMTMEHFASYCLTEPNAGSDAQSLETTAIRKHDEYILNGAKAFISGGGSSDIYAVMARTGESGAKGISCIIVEKGTEGLRFGQPEKKLGWHNNNTTMVYLDNCRVPIFNRIGEEGDGFKIALSGLNGGRVNIAACSLGGGQRAFELARAYAKERQQFGKHLSHFQSIQFKLADIITELEAARLLTYRAANSLDHADPSAVLHCAMAKRLATDVGFQATDVALQIHGGYGYLQDYPIERFFRDLRVNRILEGTNEVMRMVIAKRILEENYL